ncbi:Csa1 family protein [Staphylococcus pettenkoferi]
MTRYVSIQKNLEDFYDIQGTKNRDFEKGDKGKWILNSSIKKKRIIY